MITLSGSIFSLSVLRHKEYSIIVVSDNALHLFIFCSSGAQIFCCYEI
jgi:hypothetical protein